MHTTETGVHILWQSVVSSCGCPRELCYPLNSINHLLSLQRISFTACLCPHQTVMVYNVDCRALAFAVVVHDSIDAFDELSISYRKMQLYRFASVSLSLAVSFRHSLRQSLAHTQTHFSAITLQFPCWLRWQLKPLPNWLAVKHHFVPVIQMSSPDYVSLSTISNYYLRVKAFPFKFHNLCAFQNKKLKIDHF